MNPQLSLRKPFIWLILLSLIACGMLERDSNLASTTEPTEELIQQIDIQATIDAGVQATTAAVQPADISATLETDSEPSIAALLPTPTAQENTPATELTVTPSAPSIIPTSANRFLIDQRSRSDQDVLENVELVLRSAEVTTGTLILRLAFVNTSDQEFFLAGGANGRDARLADAAGNEYAPAAVDDNLSRGIAPQAGFTAGAANVGNLTFPLPSGGEPYEFHFPTYQPISFQLDTPLPDTTFELAEGDYPIGKTLRSSQEALAKIELRVQSLQVQADKLAFQIGFANTHRQGYDLLVGPTGRDTRLLDAEGTQYEPIEVSPSLERSVAPEGGWLPDQEHTGTITFPKPAAVEQLRFIFPSYDALTMRFNQNGMVEAQVTSASGGTPQPTPAPSVEEAAFTDLERLLEQQANALLAGDEAAYLATFAEALHAEQRQILTRIALVRLENYSLHLAPDVTVLNSDLEAGEVKNVDVEVSYTLPGINPDNTFLHDLSYTFTRTDDTWRVSAVEGDKNPPFWQTGELILRETEHFLIFARPELEGELPALEQETELAYDSLMVKGLPLEPRYVTYFTANQADFATLTGQFSSRVLGIALSRYAFDGDEIIVSSYAFYINGEAFEQEQSDLFQANRQTTITHELVHLVLAPVTRPFTPPWLAEGAAVYFSEDIDDQYRQQLLANGQLDSITLADLTRASTLGEHDFLGEQTNSEYSFSGETFAYLVETFGQEQTLEFYRSYTALPAADVRDQMPRFGGSAFIAEAVFADLREQLTAEAVQKFFGMSLAELDATVKAWLQR